MAAHEEDRRNKNLDVEVPDRVVVTYYTDPLCCWSWALQPHWERFCDVYRDEIDCRYVMGGMIADWQTFADPLNSVSSPAQMGPVWMHAAVVMQVPIDYHLWHTDPPASSYPACIAVKNAFLQSHEAGERYLQAVRRAVMAERQNIARPEVLMALAEQVAQPGDGVFSAQVFANPLQQRAARDAFRADLQQVAFHKIGRFPTITFVKNGGTGLAVTGFRPFDRLKDCMEAVTRSEV